MEKKPVTPPFVLVFIFTIMLPFKRWQSTAVESAQQ